MESLSEKVVTIAVAIIGVATLALLVSKQSNTSGVIGAAGNAFNSALGTALSPVTGGAGASRGMNNISGFVPQF